MMGTGQSVTAGEGGMCDNISPINTRREDMNWEGRGWQEGDSAEERFEGEHDGGHYERKNY